MAPEVYDVMIMQGGPGYGFAADWFSLGAMMLYLFVIAPFNLTGQSHSPHG